MPKRKFKIAFMGTPDFAVPALEKLIGSDHEVVCVYTQPPRPKGRGHKVLPSPVHELADAHEIPIRTPSHLKNNKAEQAFLQGLNLDIGIVAAYGLILTKEILESSEFGFLNIHASLLPSWRGASPIQQAIWAGDCESGITIMQMEQGLDSGPMISKQAVPIRPQTTAPSLHDELSALGAAMIVRVINNLANGQELDQEIQDESQASYAPLLTRDDGKINWSQSAQEIERQIRALNPWPGVWTRDRYAPDRGRHKILEAELTDIHLGRPRGTLVDQAGHVACGQDTALRITKIQPAGAQKPMDIASAINGNYLKTGHSFEVS